ncbi:MAG: serine hydrolase [Gloeomargaritaceae cyanobacterium C42_A2020_066]|nr:serine hydrolase [Gloeomargaritaceae cyanobacterium C42_A2020_066]
MTFYQTPPTLAAWGESLVQDTLTTFGPAGLEPDQLALTWVIYGGPAVVNTGGAIDATTFWQTPPLGVSYRGEVPIYPASVVKLFYLVALQEWLEQGMIPPDPELERAMADMIRFSSNDATGFLIDVLTGTTSGPDLSPGPYATWQYQRNLINRYFQSWRWPELVGCNLCQKTWGDGPYGRERSFVGPKGENRNKLTTLGAARLLHGIAGGVAVNGQRSQQMMDLLRRSLEPEDLAAEPENQVQGFLGEGFPPGTRLWSKAGWMSQVRHDAAYVELPNGAAMTLVVFTEGAAQSRNVELLPWIGRWTAGRLLETDITAPYAP